MIWMKSIREAHYIDEKYFRSILHLRKAFLKIITSMKTIAEAVKYCGVKYCGSLLHLCEVFKKLITSM